MKNFVRYLQDKRREFLMSGFGVAYDNIFLSGSPVEGLSWDALFRRNRAQFGREVMAQWDYEIERYGCVSMKCLYLKKISEAHECHPEGWEFLRYTARQITSEVDDWDSLWEMAVKARKQGIDFRVEVKPNSSSSD